MRPNLVAPIGGAVILAIITFFIGKTQCSADGNPIGFHASGNVQIPQADIVKCEAASCRLTFDLNTNEVQPPTSALDCDGPNCIRFNNANVTSDGRMTLTITDKDGPRTYHDYVNGTLYIVTNGGK